MKKNNPIGVFEIKNVRSFLFLGLLFFISTKSICQDRIPISFGKVSVNDFNLPKSNVIDSNTSAVIIADMGNTSFVGNKKGWVSYVFKKNTRIKIIDKKAFDAAIVRIPFYKRDEAEEKVDNILASTFNIENGKVVETKLDKNDVFDERHDKNHFAKKFTSPAVKEGSIIEYSYTITSDFYFNIPTWEFQDIQYPCLWSQYEITIPELLNYVFLPQGIHPFVIDKKSEGHASYMIRQQFTESLADPQHDYLVSAGTYKHIWAMKEVPAFSVENYISTAANYIDKIEFQLSQTYNGESTTDVKNNWAKATHDLLREENFGLSLQESNHQFLSEAEKVIGTETSTLGKAKKIYCYVRDNFSCTNYYEKYINTSLKDFFKKKNGSVGEINLFLANMLREADIHADPVLLSTRDFGFNSSRYPLMDRLNYVICRVAINGEIYYLDASRSMLGFGKLTEDCYNGHARIICEKDSGSVYFNADSIKETKLTTVIIINNEKDKSLAQGSFQSSLGNFASYDIREKFKRIGKNELMKELRQSYDPDMHIENFGIDSLNEYEEPINIHFDFSLKDSTNPNIIYFNPIMGGGYKENPFKAAERKYPVEMLYPIDNTYILNMEMPVGYTVDELPKSVKVEYNGNEGFFEYIIRVDDNSVQLRSRVKLKKAYFPADDYSTLRDFFAYVVKKQNEQIVFKKKK